MRQLEIPGLESQPALDIKWHEDGSAEISGESLADLAYWQAFEQGKAARAANDRDNPYKWEADWGDGSGRKYRPMEHQYDAWNDGWAGGASK